MPFSTNTHTVAIEKNEDSYGRMGYLNESYSTLVEMFGQPKNPDKDGHIIKTTAEWMILFNDGTLATIYNYKDDTPPEQNTFWHIGGKSSKSVLRVTEAVAKFRGDI